MESLERQNILSQFDLMGSEYVKHCAEAFKANIGRMGYFGMLPTELVFQSRRDTLFQSNALFRATGKGESTLKEFLNQEPKPEIISEFLKEAQKFESVSKEFAIECRLRMGVNVVETMLKHNSAMQSSIDALLVSIVLESWLFFEALCGDLWVASVDHAGKTISNRLGVFRGWVNPEDKITPEEAVKLEFDAKTQYGSYLRETGQISFAKLQLIKKFYGAAFGTEAEKIFDNRLYWR